MNTRMDNLIAATEQHGSPDYPENWPEGISEVKRYLLIEKADSWDKSCYSLHHNIESACDSSAAAMMMDGLWFPDIVIDLDDGSTYDLVINVKAVER